MVILRDCTPLETKEFDFQKTPIVSCSFIYLLYYYLNYYDRHHTSKTATAGAG